MTGILLLFNLHICKKKICLLSLDLVSMELLKINFLLLNSNSNFAELQLNSDLNNAIAMRLYRTTQSNVANSLKNKPSSIQSGEMIIAWLPSSQDNLYGCQFLLHTESTSQNAYMRHKIINQWTAWQKFALA